MEQRGAFERVCGGGLPVESFRGRHVAGTGRRQFALCGKTGRQANRRLRTGRILSDRRKRISCACGQPDTSIRLGERFVARKDRQASRIDSRRMTLARSHFDRVLLQAEQMTHD